MKKKILLIPLIGVILLLIYLQWRRKKEDAFDTGNPSASVEERQILKIAKDTAVKVYGYDLIASELPLNIRLKNDSIWVVTGTLEKGMKGGTVYIEISKGNKQVEKITHYK